jgi:hypothetical protein
MSYLETLGRRYKTDKVEHGYLPFYEKHIPKNTLSYLEVGIAKGASLLMFNDYFQGKVDIHCVDLFLDPNHTTQRWCREHFFVPYQCSQTDIDSLSRIHQKFELISEDASHNSAHQIITFKHLFVNNLNSGGVYFIEDTHCCNDSFYWGEGVNVFEDTPLWMFKNYLETGKIQNKFFNDGERKVFQNLIKSVSIEADEKLIIITKK